jgi:hypothetical protein
MQHNLYPHAGQLLYSSGSHSGNGGSFPFRWIVHYPILQEAHAQHHWPSAKEIQGE